MLSATFAALITFVSFSTLPPIRYPASTAIRNLLAASALMLPTSCVLVASFAISPAFCPYPARAINALEARKLLGVCPYAFAALYASARTCFICSAVARVTF